MPTIYRADRVRAVFCLVLGSLFAASGGHGLAAGGPREPSVFACVLAAMTLGVAVCILLTRVAVNGSGLEKRGPLADGFRASWDEVESWWVDPGSPDGDTLPHACFRLRGQWKSAVVYAADVSRPGFDRFLEYVRAHLADRETTEAGTAPDRGGQ